VTTQETCTHYWTGASYCAEVADGGCLASDLGSGRRKLAQGDYGGAGPELVSYLHHIEIKYEKMSDNDHMKDTFREKVALEQEIEKLRNIIKLKDIQAQLSLPKNHAQQIREKI
jgi:hypothetical protein